MDATGDTITLNNVNDINNNATNGDGGGGFINNGLLAGVLQQLTGNTDKAGVNGRTAGIAYVTVQPTITVPPAQQTIVKD